MGPDAMIFVFWMLSFKSTFWLFSFTFIKRLFSSSSLSAIRVVSSVYLRWFIFFWAVLISAGASSSLAFCLIYSAYKLNKQDDNIQPWRTPFSILNQTIVLCLVLTVASFPAYRFLRRKVRCSVIPISLRILQFVMIYTKLLAYSMKQKQVFFGNSLAFFYDPGYVGNLISGSSAFSKSNLTSESSWFTYCWRLAWRILSKIYWHVKWV